VWALVSGLGIRDSGRGSGHTAATTKWLEVHEDHEGRKLTKSFVGIVSFEMLRESSAASGLGEVHEEKNQSHS
jgi:hypothetical protein